MSVQVNISKKDKYNKSISIHLFDQKYSKSSNIVQYYYNLK